MLRQGMHIHLVGIGGFGLCPIARVLLGQGYSVSGSDQNDSAMLEALAAEGAVVTVGHSLRVRPAFPWSSGPSSWVS
jgi:UDP-N-acetylmuramate--alanine ligase